MYIEAKQAIDAAGLADDTARVAWANEVQYRWRPYFISYRTIRATLIAEGAVDAKARTEQIAGIVQQADALAHQWLSVPGDPSGNAGGVDISLPDAQAMIAQLQGAGLFSAEEAAAIVAPARTSLGERWRAWGLEADGVSAFDAALLAKLPDLAQWEAMALEWDQWLLAAVQVPSVLWAALGVDEATWTTRRDVATAEIPAWKAKILGGLDVSAMPKTGKALWDGTGA